MRDLELMLLNMWLKADIKEIYKYKDRIKAFREPLTNIELFYDLSMEMFSELEDVANHRDLIPEDVKVSVDVLINNRTKLEEV